MDLWMDLFPSFSHSNQGKPSMSQLTKQYTAGILCTQELNFSVEILMNPIFLQQNLQICSCLEFKWDGSNWVNLTQTKTSKTKEKAWISTTFSWIPNTILRLNTFKNSHLPKKQWIPTSYTGELCGPSLSTPKTSVIQFNLWHGYPQTKIHYWFQ